MEVARLLPLEWVEVFALASSLQSVTLQRDPKRWQCHSEGVTINMFPSNLKTCFLRLIDACKVSLTWPAYPTRKAKEPFLLLKAFAFWFLWRQMIWEKCTSWKLQWWKSSTLGLTVACCHASSRFNQRYWVKPTEPCVTHKQHSSRIYMRSNHGLTMEFAKA